jgi:NAD(P)-dependent dehydrogenase (short-subunit alcohol dehydrogenase family)
MEMAAVTKSILITGAGRGIGRAAALLAGARGWNVGVNFLRNEAAARETAAGIEQCGGRAICVRADVAREADVLRMFDESGAAFGRLDGFVNNAGVVAPAMTLADMSAERLEAMFRANLFGAYLCAREAVRRMATDRGGHGGAIVNVSSLAARTGAPGEYVDYAGAKAAMDAMTVGLAREAGPLGIRVNSVRPAFIDTEIHASSGNPERAHRLGAQTPLGRAGRAEEVGELIVWLLSDAASYVTGAVIDVAGGK